MAEKDIVEKALESYNDVFADIVNVLLFSGEQVVKEQSLVDAVTSTSYKAADGLHAMERDVSKYWRECGTDVRIALYGLENQTRPDKSMPLRVLGYDGASYREQLLKNASGESAYYPVVTLVLYFGEKRWNEPRALYDCMDIQEKLKPYVNDYRINLFEIAYLTDEQVRMFQSDFRIVADYFVQIRKNQNYKPSLDEVEHIHEILQLLRVMTGNPKFQDVKVKKKGGKVSMYDVFADIENRGIEQGFEQGIEQGIEQGKKELILSMLDNDIPVETVAKCAGYSLEEIAAIRNGRQAVKAGAGILNDSDKKKN